jgi:hypothetical protein
MADLFVSLVSITPKPSTVATPGPKAGANSPNNGLFTSIQDQQLQTPGK